MKLYYNPSVRKFTHASSFLNMLVILYAAFIGGWFLIHVTVPGFHWLLWALNELAGFLFLPLPFLWINSVVKRNKILTGVLALPMLVFVFLYGNAFLPKALAGNQPAGKPVRVMTYNLLNRNDAYGITTDLILAQNSGIAGFQEVVLHNGKALRERIAPQPYRFYTPLPGLDGPNEKRKFDTALFSRYPIQGYEKLHLPWRDLSWQTMVDVDGLQVRVLVIHLIPTLVREVPMSEWPQRITERETIRQKQVDRVLEIVTAAREPVLVLCDCNFTETSLAYARFSEHLHDSYRKAGWGFGNTIHAVGINLAFERIDYIWHSGHFMARSARVLRMGTSDHFAVVVDLNLLNRP